MTNVIVLREIIIEPVVLPEGWAIVTMNDGTGNELYSVVWESQELAYADADDLKRTCGLTIIRESYRRGSAA